MSDIFNTIIISLFSLMHSSFNIPVLHLLAAAPLFALVYLLLFLRFLLYLAVSLSIFSYTRRAYLQLLNKIKLFEMLLSCIGSAIALINVCIPVTRDALQIPPDRIAHAHFMLLSACLIQFIISVKFIDFIGFVTLISLR